MSTMIAFGEREETWDPTNPEEVERARAAFEEIKSTGPMLAVKMTSDRKGEQIRDFEPEADTILISRPLVGG